MLLGLGIWLILDALDQTWTIGWERPIGIGLLLFMLLTLFQWIARFDNPLQQPGAFQGGGFIGWTLASLLINAFGEVGAFLAMIAGVGIALILLFNISLPEFARRVAYLIRVMRNLPEEIRQFGKKPALPTPPPVLPTINPNRASSAAPSTSTARTPRAPAQPPPPDYPPIPSTRSAFELEENESDAYTRTTPPRPVAARIIGGSTSPTSAPVIQREWRLPEFLQILEESAEGEINQQEIRDRVHKIEETLSHFGVPAKVIEVNQGPTITQFGVEPGFVEQKGVGRQSASRQSQSEPH